MVLRGINLWNRISIRLKENDLYKVDGSVKRCRVRYICALCDQNWHIVCRDRGLILHGRTKIECMFRLRKKMRRSPVDWGICWLMLSPANSRTRRSYVWSKRLLSLRFPSAVFGVGSISEIRQKCQTTLSYGVESGVCSVSSHVIIAGPRRPPYWNGRYPVVFSCGLLTDKFSDRGSAPLQSSTMIPLAQQRNPATLKVKIYFHVVTRTRPISY